MKRAALLVGGLLTAVALQGCGGGVAGDPPPARKATIAFSALSTARLESPISGIDLSVALPEGLAVTTVGGGSGPIEDGSISSGNSLAGAHIVYGTYSASTRRVRLSMATVSDAYRGGEFLRLDCGVTDKTIVPSDALRALESSLSVKKVAGYDPGAMSTRILTGKVRVSMALTLRDAP